MKYLSGAEAAELDRLLMSDAVGFTVDQLMEHAGLCCAVAVNKEVSSDAASRIVIVCGGGNNGGDGLVCARYLQEFGHSNLWVVMIGTAKSQIVERQLKLCKSFKIEIHSTLPTDWRADDVVVDAILGFGAKGPPRSPIDGLVRELNTVAKMLLICLDTPTGWDVDKGPIYGAASLRTPEVLISLSAPKLCSQVQPPTRAHYVGGRFLPPQVRQTIPFKGADLLLKINLASE